MSSNWETLKVQDILYTTDYVANGSFASIKENVKYLNKQDYAVLIRLVDFNSGWNGDFVYVDKKSYDFLKKSYVEPKDVIISNVGANVGTVFQAPNLNQPMTLGPNSVLVKPAGDNIDRDFVYYFFTSPIGQSKLSSIVSGSAQPKFNKTDLRNIDFPLPPLPIQKKIAHILSTLDDKIELNRKMNQTLESMASAIFKSWFVDFDPVHAKANCEDEAELENIAKELGISKEILDLFPSEFTESEMGMIPKGWEAIKIGKVLKRYQAPKRYKKEAIKNFGKTVVLEQGANIILGYHDGEAEFQATEDEPMFIFGDHTCVMKLSTKPFSISENVIPLSGLIRNGYWTYYATYGQQTFQEYRRHWSELIVKEIVMAEEKLCDLFAKQIKPLILKIEQNILENNELIKTRDTLLPKLLSGEIDVSDLELKV